MMEPLQICPVCETDFSETGLSQDGFNNHKQQCLKNDIADKTSEKTSRLQKHLEQLGLSSLVLPFPDENKKRVEPHKVAQAILASWHIVTIADTEEVLLYRNGIYEFGAERILAQIIEEYYTAHDHGELVKIHFWNEILGHIQRATYNDRKRFDSDPFILSLENGLLDVRDGTLKPHTPDYLSVIQLPVRYDPEARCPRFRKFLVEVLHQEDERPLQEYMGSVLRKDYRHQTGLLLDGTGSNGKDTFLAVIRAVIGPANTSARSLHDLEENTFASADLYGKLLNYHSDLSDAELRSVSKFKQLTGGSPVSAEHKFGHAFAFVNFAKLAYACNTIPKTSEDTDAFWRRWMLITFPNKFEGPTDNRNLLSELTTPEELSGVLNWMIEGLKRLEANNWKFSYNKGAEEVREEYIRKSSPIQAFLMDCTQAESLIEIPKKKLYDAFLEYARKHALGLMQYPTFCRNLLTAAKVEECKPMIAGHRTPSFRGLFLKPKEEWGKKANREEDDTDALDRSDGHDRL